MDRKGLGRNHRGTLAVDLMSQPCRALLLLNALSGGSLFDTRLLLIHKGQHRSEAELAKNPLGKLPYLETGSGVLVESHAIMRYLAASSGRVPASLYPIDDTLKAAQIDALLDWQHTNLRQGAGKFVFINVLAPMRGVDVQAGVLKSTEATLHASLSTLSTVFLRGGKHPWLGGISKTPTFADISAVCELDQLRMLPAAQHEAIASRHPAVFAWARRVGEHFEPHYGEVTAMLRKAVAARRERAKM